MRRGLYKVDTLANAQGQIQWQTHKGRYNSKRVKADLRKGSLGNCKEGTLKENFQKENLQRGIVLRTTDERRSNIS